MRKRLCDTNNDTLCNVSDIVGAAQEILAPASPVRRQIAPRQCLAGVINPCCGNGVLAPGDGCNGACRVESGFTCIGEPSVCSRPE